MASFATLTKTLCRLPASTGVEIPRALSASASSAFQLPPLTYDYGELEPFISAEIMQLHHSKHHQTYVNNLNAALEKYAEAEAKSDLATMIGLQGSIKFNGGGHINHSIFWQNLAPPSKGGGEPPSGELLNAINSEFKSFEDFKKKFEASTVAVQGSGWGWLGFNKATGRVQIATSANQDPIEAI